MKARPKPNEALAGFLLGDERGQWAMRGLMGWIEYWRDVATNEALAKGDTEYAKGRVSAFNQVLRDLPKQLGQHKDAGDTPETPA